MQCSAGFPDDDKDSNGADEDDDSDNGNSNDDNKDDDKENDDSKADFDDDDDMGHGSMGPMKMKMTTVMSPRMIMKMMMTGDMVVWS